ncbi:siderophore-interacting protein [Arthrobacter sp. CAU 1506]|uniref:siderophore-interacting protein n=1 Tax=Arthrobacter sp. CAU 1506 TaxID=2560052 RepID=UPI0010AC83C2|nr:siderophore-interacting protein [Arthrobacter sp. CAU 1506]TJY69760.1 siderophore-interacting protein [Arthrobacter sp. CAU 1506]
MTAVATETSAVVPVLAFGVAVSRVEELSPSYRRITFSGESLRRFGVDGPTLDLRIKVMIPSLGADGQRLPLPPFGVPVGRTSTGVAVELGGGWYQQWLAMDPAERGSMRTYTVREFRPAAGALEAELDVDFVLHFDAEGNGGPASCWAAAAGPGDEVTIIGPNVEAAQCATAKAYGGIEWRPGLASHVLLAGDETALPAIAAILESLPEDMTGNAVLEVPDAADFQDIRSAADVQIAWLARGDRPHGELLSEAVRTAVVVPGAGLAEVAGEDPEEVDVDRTILWETTTGSTRPFYAWIAGEAAVIRELRRYLVRDVGVDRKQVAFMGYWRAGKAEL